MVTVVWIVTVGSIVQSVSLLFKAISVMGIGSMVGSSMMDWGDGVRVMSISSVMGSVGGESILLGLVVSVSKMVGIVSVMVWSNGALVKSMVVVVFLSNIIGMMSIGSMVDWGNSVSMVGVA